MTGQVWSQIQITYIINVIKTFDYFVEMYFNEQEKCLSYLGFNSSSCQSCSGRCDDITLFLWIKGSCHLSGHIILIVAVSSSIDSTTFVICSIRASGAGLLLLFLSSGIALLITFRSGSCSSSTRAATAATACGGTSIPGRLLARLGRVWLLKIRPIRFIRNRTSLKPVKYFFFFLNNWN